MKLVLTLFLLLFISIPIHAEQLRIAVASNFILPMKALIKAYEKEHNHLVQASYGSSGKLFAQITHGAPFDIFLSADQEKPRSLVESSFAEPSNHFTYAQGSLVLWSKKRFAEKSLTEILTSENYLRIALANPKVAPYGMAAQSVLDKLALTESTKAKWVMGENISQVFSFVAFGSVELGFVANSQLIGKNSGGQVWQIDAALYPPIKQDAVLLNKAKDKNTAIKFWQFLRSDKARDIIQSFGYVTFSPR
ncbi:molybdate ABC transporter substrate-binding protein [Thalassotalea sediminis]|uniref:molybdate ABC transporter substrate-binding protein n=1 Tax=Thalassotalea sediminis TaxID=1759089 RepID=UPI00257421D2|nr:molybdate ABC transporter substrate-binding protein [Thalassotalea sediminis]